MKMFMDKDFLLGSDTAKKLYHDFAAHMPVIDYHCHVNPAEIAQNRRFDNLAQAWLGGDHYKWRLIRANGTQERLITGADSTDYEKFIQFAHALPKAIGNPVYHWAHLELRRYFDCDLTLSPDTADEIWNICNRKLAGGFGVRDIIKQSRVTAIATTDDPVDTLEWHKQLAADASFDTKVVPAFRPDKAIQADKPGFAAYVAKLGEVAGVAIRGLDDLFAALESRLNFFDTMGCKASDHGLDYVPFVHNAMDKAPALLLRALAGETLTQEEADAYKTAVLLFLGKQYAKRGWVMQLHYGAQRNLNAPMFEKLGPDTGYDAIGSYECGLNIAALLNALEASGELPKTILYSMNPNDDAMLVSIAGCFMGTGTVCKLQHGSAWWFNDTRKGMEEQLTNLATRGLLGGFVGMLTDSRSFLSYTRHEYFRRILCNLLGNWVENGEYPNDMAALGSMVQDISYTNTQTYFGF